MTDTVTKRRYWYDTEFREDGHTVDLISIGVVAQDGREYYAVNRDADWVAVAGHDWLMTHVVPYLPQATITSHVAGVDLAHPDVKSRRQIGDEVLAFLLPDLDIHPELWAWYGAYDHVALAWLWGPMSNLPRRLPMWTNDLRQEAYRLGDPPLPDQPRGEHHALADARHNRTRHQHLELVAARRDAALSSGHRSMALAGRSPINAPGRYATGTAPAPRHASH